MEVCVCTPILMYTMDSKHNNRKLGTEQGNLIKQADELSKCAYTRESLYYKASRKYLMY